MKVRRISRLFLPLLILVALPASAHASWTAPFDISDPGQNSYAPQVGVDATGRGFFVWDLCCHFVQLRTRSAAGSLGPVQTLTPLSESNSYPRVAVNPNGDAAFVWGHDAHGSLQGRTLTSGGTLGPIQLIAGPGASYPSPSRYYNVAIDANGNAIFVWRAQDTSTQCGGTSCWRFRTRTLSSTGTLSTIQSLSAAGQNAFGAPELGVDANGNVIYVWESCASTTCSLQTRVRSPSGTLSAPQQLGAGGGGSAEVAVTPSGSAVFTWEAQDGTTNCYTGGCYRIQTRTRSASGALSTVQTLSDGGEDAYIPQVAVDPNGNAVFIWERWDGTLDCPSNGNPNTYPCLRVQTRSRTAAGALSTVQTLSAAGSMSEYPLVGIDQNDTAVLVWWSRNLKAIRARTRSSAGVLSATQTISDPGEPTYGFTNGTSAGGNDLLIYPVALAVNPAGNALADFHSFDGSNARIDGAAGP